MEGDVVPAAATTRKINKDCPAVNRVSDQEKQKKKEYRDIARKRRVNLKRAHFLTKSHRPRRYGSEIKQHSE
jgi:hypothetical protein